MREDVAAETEAFKKAPSHRKTEGEGCIRKEGDVLRRKKIRYTSDMPRVLYTFFITCTESGEIPSISKFARRYALTVEDVEKFRSHKEFDKAYKEANEIRRDYLIDSALVKKFDPSFTKFILSEDFTDEKTEESIDINVKVEQ